MINDKTTSASINTLINGYIATLCLIAAHELDLFSLLSKKACSENHLKDLLKANDVYKLRAILYVLVFYRIIDKNGDLYSANDFTNHLSNPNEPNGWLLKIISDQYLPSLQNLAKAVPSNKTAFHLTFDKNPWEHRISNSKSGNIFQTWLDLETKSITTELVDAWDWQQYESIIDVGAGKGALAKKIAEKNKHVKVSIFDIPSVIQEARKSSDELNSSLEFIAGDFFSSIPSNHSLYILKSVIHDWNDADALRILRNLKMAIENSSGNILVIERTLKVNQISNSTLGNKASVELNLIMSALHGSHERSHEEFTQLFSVAKLKISSEKQLKNGFHIFKLCASN